MLHIYLTCPNTIDAIMISSFVLVYHPCFHCNHGISIQHRLNSEKNTQYFPKKLISQKKIQGFAQWQNPIKVGELAKERKFLFRGRKKKKKNTISLQVFFAFWTSDKNLEIYYRISNVTLTLVQILQILKFPYKNTCSIIRD